MNDVSESPDNKQLVNDSLARIKELMTEIDSLIPKVMDGNKVAARKVRVSLNSMKKQITPLRQNILEIVKTAKKN